MSNQHWHEIKVGSTFNLVYGKGLRTKEFLKEGYNVYGANGIIGKYDQYTFEEEKIIISCRGAASGVVHKTLPKSFITSNSIVFNFPGEFINIDFLKYALTNAEKQDIITGSAQPQITIQNLNKLSLPLPPLNEQKRIADKLDQVFQHIDSLQQRLNTIPELLKQFRKMILQKAVIGELTKKWRKENAIEEWINTRLANVCLSVTDGDHQAPPKVKNGIPFLVISNISKGVLNFDSVTRFVPREYFEALKETRVPKIGDILYTVTGSYGISVLVEKNKEFCFQRHIAILKPDNTKVISEYLNYTINSSLIKEQADTVATGIAQKTVSLRGLRSFDIPLPSIEEQELVVKKIKDLFLLADQIESKFNKIKQQLDTLPQQLLTKAFRGELVSQDHNDEPAEKLLKKIEEEIENLKPTKKKRK